MLSGSRDSCICSVAKSCSPVLEEFEFCSLMFLIRLAGGFFGTNCCWLLFHEGFAERHTLPGRFSYNYCIALFWLDIFGGVLVRTLLRIFCMGCFVLVSSVVLDVFEIVASVGVVVVPEGSRLVELLFRVYMGNLIIQRDRSSWSTCNGLLVFLFSLFVQDVL